MDMILINQQSNKAIELTTEVTQANVGALLLLQDSVYIRMKKSNISTVLDWEKFQILDKTIPTLEDEYTNSVQINQNLFIAASNGLDANIDNTTINLSGNFHYGTGKPTAIQNLLENEIGFYLNILDNSIYIWNPVSKKWTEPFQSISVISDNKISYGYDTLTNILNIPTVLPIPKITVTKKIGLTATLDAKATVAATNVLIYKWEQLGGTVNASIADSTAASTAIFVSSPGSVIFRLTVIDKNGLLSNEQITLNFSYSLQVLGTDSTNFSFQTLGEAFEWIRVYDLKNEEKYIIEVFNTTEEKFDIILPTASNVIFRNGSVSANIIFSENKKYVWSGVNSTHILLKDKNTISIQKNADVTFNNIYITCASKVSACIVIDSAVLTVNAVTILAYADAIHSVKGTLTISQSTIASSAGQSLFIDDGEYKFIHSNFLTDTGATVASLINSTGIITYCIFTQNNVAGSFNIFIENNKPTKIQLINNVFMSMVKMQNGVLAGNMLLKNSGETLLISNTIISKDSIALCIICNDITASSNYIDGNYSIIANQNSLFLALDYITRYDKILLNNLKGMVAMSALDGTNHYEL